MNDLRTPRSPRLSDDDLDGMLRAFFQSEVPRPWPVLGAPEIPQPTPLAIRPWWKRTGRFAVAASVALMLAGYLTLAGGFPRFRETPAEDSRPLIKMGPIGSQPVRIRRAHTPDGREVLIWEQKENDGRFILKAQFTKDPKEKR